MPSVRNWNTANAVGDNYYLVLRQHGATCGRASAQRENTVDRRARRRQDLPNIVSSEWGIRGGSAQQGRGDHDTGRRHAGTGANTYSRLFRYCTVLCIYITFLITCHSLLYYIFIAVEQTDDQLTEEIQKAHVICVVYSVDDEDTLDRAASYWLPLIRRCSPDNRCPVVLVGNKIDLVDYSTIEVCKKI